MKKLEFNELIKSGGVIKPNVNKKALFYLNNLELIANVKNNNIVYGVLDRNEVKIQIINDKLINKLDLLSKLMTDYLSKHDNVEESNEYNISVRSIQGISSGLQDLKNLNGELIFKYPKFAPNQIKRLKLELEIEEILKDINNLLVDEILKNVIILTD